MGGGGGGGGSGGAGVARLVDGVDGVGQIVKVGSGVRDLAGVSEGRIVVVPGDKRC